MPELPDLEIFRENLGKQLLGKEVVSAAVYDVRRVSITGDALAETLGGAKLKAIERNGKELYFTFSNKAVFSVHLMLKGRFSLHERGTFPKGLRGKLMSVGFDDGRDLTVSDEMGWCKIVFTPKKPRAPDVLSDKFTFAYFDKRARANSMINVKTFLLTQSNMRGIGNAYADEMLWRAGISPASLTGRIPEDKLRELYEAILWVSRDAIEQIRRVAPDIIAGEERGFLRVHNKDKVATDEGDVIIVDTIASKKTYYTARQVLY